MAAAQAWVSGALVQGNRRPGALEDAALFGFDQSALAGLEARLGMDAEGFSVWPENAETVDAFLCVASQWRTTLMPTQRGLALRYLGLDYTAARTALDALQIRVTPELWSGLAIMESAATAALNRMD